MNAVGVFGKALPLLRAGFWAGQSAQQWQGRVRVTVRCEQTPSVQGRCWNPRSSLCCLRESFLQKLHCIDLLNPAQSECSHFLILLYQSVERKNVSVFWRDNTIPALLSFNYEYRTVDQSLAGFLVVVCWCMWDGPRQSSPKHGLNSQAILCSWLCLSNCPEYKAV